MIYLGRFQFVECPSVPAGSQLLSITDLSDLLEAAREKHRKEGQKVNKRMLAVHFTDPSLTQVFPSLAAFARHVGGDRASIRAARNKGTLYRGVWSLDELD